MFTAQDNRRATGGFTLLEITLAVAILAMMSLAIYRFVESTVTVLRISSETTAADARYEGLRDLLTAQWQTLAPGTGALLGETYILNDRSRDEVRWVCSAGPGLLTRYGAGDYAVVMRLRTPDKEGDRFDLGLTRKPENLPSGAGGKDNWVPLIENVRSLEVRYFDPRLNTWLEKWSDTVTLPRLVKVIIGRRDTSVPWEVIIPLGRTPL